MATTRARSGDQAPTERRHVGLTMPRSVKEQMLASAGALEWSAGDWVLAVAAEHGPRLRRELDGRQVAKRPKVKDASFAALYLAPDERDELDDQAVACGLNRSAFVTAVTQLGLEADVEVVVDALLPRTP